MRLYLIIFLASWNIKRSRILNSYRSRSRKFEIRDAYVSGGPTSAPLGNHRTRSVHEAPRHLMVLFNAFNLYNLIFFFQVGKIICIYFHESSREISAEIINF